MKYILLIFSFLGSQLYAQTDKEYQFEEEVWVCFNCVANDTAAIGQDTLSLLQYDFARYVSNLNFHAETLPKFLFKSNGELQQGDTVDRYTLELIPTLNLKWKYKYENMTSVVIEYDSNEISYELLHTDHRFRLVRIRN